MFLLHLQQHVTAHETQITGLIEKRKKAVGHTRLDIMAAEDLVDFSEVRAAKEHTLAVNRDYISQPRLSSLNVIA